MHRPCPSLYDVVEGHIIETTAVVFTGKSQVALQRMEMPPPGPGEGCLGTADSGISAGTEGWGLGDEFTWSATPYPCVPGYQRVGTITAVGPDVGDWKVGDRAFAIAGAWEGAVNSFWGAHVA